MPLYDVWDEENGETREENDPGQIEADSIEEAVEEFVRECDRQGDFGYVRSGEATIHAAEAGSEVVVVFNVCCETMPVYTASAKGAPR